ncbi:hypothetical protein ACKKBG_A36200 [Auxenochlorella protothecoides x Auxenochlorella symbiontica]
MIADRGCTLSGEQVPGCQTCHTPHTSACCRPETSGIAKKATNIRLCRKCRDRPAQVVVRQHEPLCSSCLHDSISAKARSAIRSHALIRPGDTVVLAYSGGHASALLLHLLAAMRSLNLKHPEKRKVPFTLHVVHIDERAAHSENVEESGPGPSAHAAAVGGYCTDAGVAFHAVPLHAVLLDGGSHSGTEPNTAAGAGRLRALLDSVADATARDDTLRALRTRLLLRTARALGARSLALGCSSTRLAAHALAEACKGRGHGVAAGARLVDARHGPALPFFFRPFRDTSTRELAACAHLLALPVPARAPQRYLAGRRGARSINLLAEDFALALLAANPSAASNVMSVLDRLQAFDWSEAGRAGGVDAQTGRAQDRGATLCPLCLNPCGPRDGPGRDGVVPEASRLPVPAAEALAQTCAACRVGVLGLGLGRNHDPDEGTAAALLGAFAALAAEQGEESLAGRPAPVPRERMRAAIADCLL